MNEERDSGAGPFPHGYGAMLPERMPGRAIAEYQHPDTALEAAAESLKHSGWREMEWDDARSVVTMLRGEDLIDVAVTSPEKADAIAERNHGAFEEREFNAND